ncbi:MAG TPA: nitroreductase family protein [Spirochaetota bacterium]|nr:nitroreductase family protein [Spirochaetota bacterium]
MAENKIENIIRMRYSCRSYKEARLSDKDRSELGEFVSQKITGPFGTNARFTLFAAEPLDSTALKGLGTYGFIRNPAAFVAGVVKESEMNFEDYGYSMERIILHATEMGLGSCWLGGSFRRSRFAEKAGIAVNEIIPAVASIGYAADKKTLTDRFVRATAGSDKRKERGELFFSSSMDKLNTGFEDGYGKVLEMVRLAPSASNKQPWRILKENGKDVFHFFLERTASYSGKIKLIGGADLQRVDMGIAMCHFECTAIESGLKGLWKCEAPADIKYPASWEYSITWDGE